MSRNGVVLPMVDLSPVGGSNTSGAIQRVVPLMSSALVVVNFWDSTTAANPKSAKQKRRSDVTSMFACKHLIQRSFRIEAESYAANIAVDNRWIEGMKNFSPSATSRTYTYLVSSFR